MIVNLSLPRGQLQRLFRRGSYAIQWSKQPEDARLRHSIVYLSSSLGSSELRGPGGGVGDGRILWCQRLGYRSTLALSRLGHKKRRRRTGRQIPGT